VLDESLRLEIARLENSGAKSAPGNSGEDRTPEVESHVNRLLKLLKKLESINDRADGKNSHASGSSQDFDLLVIAALREAECADLIEKSMEADLTGLCDEIKRKNDGLQAGEIALAKLKESSNAQLAELENRIQNQESQLRNLETEQRRLTDERDHLVNSLSAAKSAAEQAEANARQFKQRMQEEVSALRLQLENRDVLVDTGKAGGVQAEGDQQKEIETLQLRLQDIEAKLAVQEKDISEKDRAIHAAGVREKELGKLIERLSAECEKLSAELCDKKLGASRAEDKTRSPLINGGKAWGKVIGLVRAGRTPSDK
jgi:DNA repair exonuclease SbcCD ATPase subunit